MAVAVQQPNRPPKDPLDTIIKGLQIAGSVYGIREASAKLDEMDAAKQARESSTAGIVTPQQEAGLVEKGLTPVTPDTPGAIVLKRSSDGSEVAYGPPKPKAELSTPKTQVYRDVDGQNKIGKVDPKTGDIVRSSNDVLAEKQPNDEKPKPDKEPKPTQYQAALYGRRVEAAQNTFDDLSSSGYDRTKGKQGVLSYLPSSLQPGELQQQEQAERNFVNAVLRRESGSAISKGEFDSAEKQYFPRSGDSPEVLAQKSQNRQQVLEGLRAEAGNAWAEVKPVSLTPPKAKPSSGSGSAVAAPASKPKQVIQNGHTYFLNEKTGNYE